MLRLCSDSSRSYPGISLYNHFLSSQQAAGDSTRKASFPCSQGYLNPNGPSFGDETTVRGVHGSARKTSAALHVQRPAHDYTTLTEREWGNDGCAQFTENYCYPFLRGDNRKGASAIQCSPQELGLDVPGIVGE